jgi:sugar phosphate isomerase/epimerase
LRLRPRRISFAEDVFLENCDEAAALIAAGPFVFESLVASFMNGQTLDAGPAAIAKNQDALCRTIDLAASMGARSLYVATGGRGALTWEEAAKAFCAAIAPCVAHAEARGVGLAIENIPTVYAHVSIALSLRDTVLLAEMAGTGVCMDMFACWTEAGLRQTIERAAQRLQLVQIADYVYGDLSLPARAVPGDGVIPIRRLIDWTLAAGYGGAFELEMIGPRIRSEGFVPATRRAADAVSGMLDELRA